MIAAEMTTEDWVIEQLDKLGYNSSQMWRIMEWKLDWHELKSLVDRGCPIETALDILQPL
jgi:hypothetical protein